jgi:hypothetical protein
MTELIEKDQFQTETHTYKCWCGENSYLTIVIDREDGEAYISITQSPTRLIERLSLAWKALRGIEFTSSNEVIISDDEVEELMKMLIKMNVEKVKA